MVIVVVGVGLLLTVFDVKERETAEENVGAYIEPCRLSEHARGKVRKENNFI